MSKDVVVRNYRAFSISGRINSPADGKPIAEPMKETVQEKSAFTETHS